MARREREPTSAIEVLNPEFGRLAHGHGVLLSAWRASVGVQIAAHASPSSLKDGVLRVRCDTSIWATEITHLGPEILERMLAHVPDLTMHRVHCYTARAGTPTSDAGEAPDPDAPIPGPTPGAVPQLRELEPAEEAAIEATAAPLADERLRASVERAMAASRRVP